MHKKFSVEFQVIDLVDHTIVMKKFRCAESEFSLYFVLRRIKCALHEMTPLVRNWASTLFAIPNVTCNDWLSDTVSKLADRVLSRSDPTLWPKHCLKWQISIAMPWFWHTHLTENTCHERRQQWPEFGSFKHPGSSWDISFPYWAMCLLYWFLSLRIALHIQVYAIMF